MSLFNFIFLCPSNRYNVYYAEQMHGHDSVVWPGVLAEGLIALRR
jgi:enterochelin esterase-like enzyme